MRTNEVLVKVEDVRVGDVLVSTSGGRDMPVVALDRVRGAVVFSFAYPGSIHAGTHCLDLWEVGGQSPAVTCIRPR